MELSVGVPMTAWRAARVAAILVLTFICISCGDTFRPVAVPIQPPPPDPSGFHFVLSLSDNGVVCNALPPDIALCDSGASTRIDVSGDTNVGVARLGLGPVHAALLPNASKIYVANSLEDTVSEYAPADATRVTTVSLPQGSVPVFVHTTENGTVYVANFGNGTVSAVSTTSNVVASTTSVGTNPVALAETPDGRKLYVVNQGDGTVTSINTVGMSVSNTIPVGGTPVWALAGSGSNRVYVLDSATGTVFVIDTVSDQVAGTAAAGAGANSMFYEKKLNRLYVTNPANNTVTILDASTDALTSVTPLPVPIAASPVAVAALPDGSRVYVVSSKKVSPCISGVADCISSQVTVLNATDGSLRSTIPLESAVNITAASHSGLNTTYSYTLTSGPALGVGMRMVIAGMGDAGNNGTFTITASSASAFTVVNDAGITASSQSGTGAVIVEIDAVNPAGCNTDGPGVPGGSLGGVRFRFSAAAAADSTRVFVTKCDAGSTAIIRTSDDTPVLDLRAPFSSFNPPNAGDPPPPQNPVFLLVGP